MGGVRSGAWCFQPDSVETESSVPLGCLWEEEGMAEAPIPSPRQRRKARVPAEPRDALAAFYSFLATGASLRIGRA